MVKEIKILNDVELVLKQIWGNGSKRYAFKLCCKNIVKIYNPCPGESIALKLDKCVDALGSTFCIDSSDNMTFTNQVINVNENEQSIQVAELNGKWLLFIDSDPTEHVNTICVSDLCIPVEADCLDEQIIGKCALLSTFVKPVYVNESLLLTQLYIRAFNILNEGTYGEEIDSDSLINGDSVVLKNPHDEGFNDYPYFSDLPDGSCPEYDELNGLTSDFLSMPNEYDGGSVSNFIEYIATLPEKTIIIKYLRCIISVENN